MHYKIINTKMFNKSMKDFLTLIRPKHWIKNVLIIVPCLFGGMIFEIHTIGKLFLGVLAFSLMASSVYIINDIRDVEKDREHEIKRYRPIAARRITTGRAITYTIVLIGLSELVTCSLDIGKSRIFALVTINIYLILNIAYSFGLKDEPIVDVMILASGFVLRIVYGSQVGKCNISQWLLLTVLMFSMYMGLGKRRNEMRKTDKSSTRNVLKFYTDSYLSRIMLLTMTMGLVFYSLWATFIVENGTVIIWSIPLVIAILMKYELDVEKDNFGDPVDILTNDHTILTMVCIYAVFIISVLYFPNFKV